MLIGAHSIIYSKDPEADRAFLRDILGLPHIDVGDGWLIFGLPPAEVAVHPSAENDVHEFYFMSDDIQSLVKAMSKRKIASTPVQNLGWGLLTQLTLPGGGKLGVYQPRHARPKSMQAGKKNVKPAPAAKKAARGSRKAALTAKKTTRKASEAKSGRR